MDEVKSKMRNLYGSFLSRQGIGVQLPMNTKYMSRNIIAQQLINRFMNAMFDLLKELSPNDLLEVGCGEGIVLQQLSALFPTARKYGVDLHPDLIPVARQIVPSANTWLANAYHLPLVDDCCDLVVCMEVLEHLEDPEAALAELSRVASSHCLLSVPHEPWWRILNMSRGKYLTSFGNTPGHLNNWSSRSFSKLISKYVDVVDMRHPLPWTMVLGKIR